MWLHNGADVDVGYKDLIFKDIKFVQCERIVLNLEVNMVMHYVLYYRALYQKG